MSFDDIVQRLEKPRKTGKDKVQAKCPAHDDKSPSLVVRELEDGRVLLHCFAGCGAAEILSAIGLDFSDLYPPKTDGDYKPRVRRPFSAFDALTALAFESLVVLQYANLLATGAQLVEADRNRLLLSASRIQKAREVVA